VFVLNQVKTIADPATGTGGFFLVHMIFVANYDLDRGQKQFLKYKTLWKRNCRGNPPFGFDESVST